jgi:hypothetical protein
MVMHVTTLYALHLGMAMCTAVLHQHYSVIMFTAMACALPTMTALKLPA